MLSRMRGRISVVVLLALAMAGCSGPDQATAPVKPADFVRHANAVQSDSVDGTGSAYSGIVRLVPLGSCAIGIGLYRGGSGNVAANWTGNADCTSFTVSANRPGLAATSAVALADGSVVGANAVLQRLNPDGTVTPLADLRVQGHAIQPSSIVRSGDRLVIGGGQTDDDKSSPLMWASSDGGKTVTPVQVPAVNGLVGPMAANDNTIVAVEQTAEENGLGVWRSTDNGRNWQLAELASGNAQPIITNVLRTAKGWLIVGYGRDDQNPAGRPFLANSSDGVTWQVLDTSKVGAGRILDAAITKNGDLVVIGDGPTGGCSVAWTGSVDSLRRVDLGCDDVAKAVTTLADGRVIIVGAHDVWVRA
jgi:hypothetical protein